MRLKSCTLTAVTLGLLASSSQAALIGTSVTGTLNFASATNYFDPANGLVPTGFGYLNTTSPTVTIAEPATEFGFQDGSNRDTANFTNSQLLIQDQSFSGFVGNTPFTMTFTDTAFAGQMPVLVTNTYPSLPTASITGNTLTISYPGTALPSGSANTLALTLYNIVAVPEPTSLATLGLTAAGLVRRRRAGR